MPARSSSSPIKLTSVAGRLRSKSISTIEEEEEDGRQAQRHQQQQPSSSSSSSRRSSSTSYFSPSVSPTKSTSGSGSGLNRGRSTSQPIAMPRPKNTISQQEGQRSPNKQAYREPSTDYDNNEQQEDDQEAPSEPAPAVVQTTPVPKEVITIKEPTIDYAVIIEAMKALQELQSSLAVSAYQSMFWEAEAKEAEKRTLREKATKKRIGKLWHEHDDNVRQTVELMSARVRESLRILRDEP